SLRRRRQPDHVQPRRLHDDLGRPAAVRRADPDGDADAGQPARRQGDRRVGDDRLDARRALGRGPWACPSPWWPHRHALHPREGLAGDRGGVELSETPGDPPPGTWLNRGEELIYDSPWVRLVIADVLMPDGTQVDHHIVRVPRDAAGTIIVREGRVLLMYRHRFITDTWG